MSIKPDNPTLSSLLQGRLFFIPDYQRAYSWQSKQRADLFHDINIINQHNDPERHHFMATVVCLRRGRRGIAADEYGVFELVDGQQRITTLIILLKAVAKKLHETGNEGEANKLQTLLVKEDSTLLFESNHDERNFLAGYLKTGHMPAEDDVQTAAESNLLAACQDCEAYVDTWDDVFGLLRILKNRLDFILFVLEDEATVYTTFEVLNSRGLDVDWLDKTKSMLMGVAAEYQTGDVRERYLDELHQRFQSIYRTIGLEPLPGQEILRFAACLHAPEAPSRIGGSEGSLEFLQTTVEHDPSCVLNVAQQLLEVTQALRYLRDDWRIRGLTRIAHVRLLAVAILLRQQTRQQQQTSNDQDALFAAWEKVTFRIFGLARRDARTKVGEYTRLAHQLANDTALSTHAAAAAITALGSDYSGNKAVSAMHHSNALHGWEDELRYFFYHYDKHLATQHGQPFDSEQWAAIFHKPVGQVVECIYPENPQNGWSNMADSRLESIYYLGNLLVMPPRVNVLTASKPFEDKCELYDQFAKVLSAREVTANDTWTYSQIVAREKHLLAWAKQYWA